MNGTEEIGASAEVVDEMVTAGLRIPQHGIGKRLGLAPPEGHLQLRSAGRALSQGAGIDGQGWRNTDGVEGAPRVHHAAGMFDPMTGRAAGEAVHGHDMALVGEFDPTAASEMISGLSEGGIVGEEISERHAPSAPQGLETSDGDAPDGRGDRAVESRVIEQIERSGHGSSLGRRTIPVSPPSGVVTVDDGRHGSTSERVGELAHRGSAIDAGFAAVQPARQTGGLLRVGERVVPVNENRR